MSTNWGKPSLLKYHSYPPIGRLSCRKISCRKINPPFNHLFFIMKLIFSGTSEELKALAKRKLQLKQSHTKWTTCRRNLKQKHLLHNSFMRKRLFELCLAATFPGRTSIKSGFVEAHTLLKLNSDKKKRCREYCGHLWKVSLDFLCQKNNDGENKKAQ